jgi:hypothetical protein
MLGPKIDFQLYFGAAKARILEELKDWDDRALEGGVPTPEEITDIGRRLFADMARGSSGLDFLHHYMCEHWQHPDAASWDKTVHQCLQNAMEECWAQKDAELAKRAAWSRAQQIEGQKTTAQQLAAEKAAKVQRERDAQLTKLIAKEFNISPRHARNLRNEGTADPVRAARLAEVLGGDPSDYLRKGRRKRETDLVRMFMTAEHAQVSFTHFISDPDEAITDDDLKEFLRANIRKLKWGEDLYSFEAVVDRTRELGYTSLSLEAAENLWKAYKLWRIRTISSIAIYDVEDGR